MLYSSNTVPSLLLSQTAVTYFKISPEPSPKNFSFVQYHCINSATPRLH
ncbi:hypothetical protein MXB_2090 [Myxobolus squamalis]|nr:hypothetical protein MXB_2090 [Myxobolus squamalis]